MSHSGSTLANGRSGQRFTPHQLHFYFHMQPEKKKLPQIEMDRLICMSHMYFVQYVPRFQKKKKAVARGL